MPGPSNGRICASAENGTERYCRGADYVARIRSGTPPSPIEQPAKFEFALNLRLGLEIPPALLARADEVIEIILLFRNLKVR
jgi:hypothetical protein